jgi:transposase
MAKALSIDLRHRVVAAIAEGMSRRQAAARFGVSAASAVRWHQRFKASGTVAPSRQGGDRRSGRIETYSEVILGLVTETPDMTLAELRTKLKERRVSAGIGTLWRFFKRRRRGITLKKRRRMRLSSNAAM